MPDELLTGALEENVLTLLCYDEDNAPALAARLTEDIFSTRVYRDIAKVAINHLMRFNTPPAVHLMDMFEDRVRRGDAESKLLRQTLEAMQALAADIQADFVLAALDEFINARQLSMALEKAMELLARGKLNEAQDAVHSVGAARTVADGLWLHDTEFSLKFLDNIDAETFSSGIDALDDRRFCPARKTLFLWIAASGGGKTWGLVNCGRANMVRGKNVLHITLEMEAVKIAQRYVQNLFALAREDLPNIRVPRFVRDDLGRCINIDFNEFNARGLTPEMREELQSKMGSLKNRGRLMIQEFASGTLSTERLEAYLEFLDRKHRFRPDLVIVDYWDLMQIDSGNLRIDTGRIGVKLRGMATMRNFALITATQGNRASYNAAIVKREHVSEDKSKIDTSDFVATYSQTEAEEGLNLARIYTDKGRDVPQHYQVLISQSYATGQFCIDSVFMDSRIKEKAKTLAGDDA